MTETLSHKEVAAQFAIPDDWLTKKEFAKRQARSRVLTVPTGFYDRHDRQQMVMVRTDISPNSDTAGHIAVVEGMAVTDDTQRESSIGHNAGMNAFVKHHTGEDISIISVGNPGIANPAWRPKLGKDQTYGLTFAQAAELWRGEFNLVSQALARAAAYAMELEGLNYTTQFIRVAPSLDASSASAGIGHMLDNGIDLRRVALLDPVGLSKERGAKRIKQFLGVAAEHYLAANHTFHRDIIETGADWAKRAARSPANLLYGLRGVSLGGAAGALRETADTMREDDVSLRIYAAGASEFDTVPGAIETVNDLRWQGVNAELVVIDGSSHAMTMSAGAHGRAVVDYINDKTAR